MNLVTLGGIRLRRAARNVMLVAAFSSLAACGSLSLKPASSSSAGTETMATGYAGGRATFSADEDAKRVVSVVMTSKFGYVRIEREEDGEAPNDQPVHITADQIRGFLDKLTV